MELVGIDIISPIELCPIDTVYWKLVNHAHASLHTSEGILSFKMDKGWVTDLRSGSSIIDCVIPKWGNPEYTFYVLIHDMAYSGWVSFELANDICIRQGLALSGEISKFRASLAYHAVQSFGRSHYSELMEPLSYPYQNNREKEHFNWSPK